MLRQAEVLVLRLLGPGLRVLVGHHLDGSFSVWYDPRRFGH